MCVCVVFTLFQLSWFEVLSGATVLAATVTSLNYNASVNRALRQTQLIYHRNPLIKKMN